MEVEVEALESGSEAEVMGEVVGEGMKGLAWGAEVLGEGEGVEGEGEAW